MEHTATGVQTRRCPHDHLSAAPVIGQNGGSWLNMDHYSAVSRLEQPIALTEREQPPTLDNALYVEDR